MDKSIRVLSLGAGAIGTYIGGSLAMHGNEVVFLERPQVAQQLREGGLHLNIDGRKHTIPELSIYGSIQEVLTNGPYDVGLFALKSFDTQSALMDLQLFKEHLPPILCLQNGVENEALISKHLGGNDMVIAGTVTSSIGKNKPGEITLERLRGVGIADTHPISEQLKHAMSSAGLNARLYPRYKDMKWSKLLTNLVTNASSAILDMDPSEIIRHPKLFQLEIAQLEETLQVMKAQDIHTVNLPATPVKLLEIGVRYIPAFLSRRLFMHAVGGGRGGKKPSFHIDLYSGRGKIEVDYLNGAVVRFGQKFGLQTPVNQLLNETLLALSQGKIPNDTYSCQPDKLVAQLSKFT